MKTKIDIEDGKVCIIMFPENEFETDIIDKADNSKWKPEIRFYRDYGYGVHSKHKIIIDLKEKNNE